MKTYKNLYPQICDFATLYAAYRRARCGKRDRVAVASFEFDLERNLLQLQDELRAHAYAPGGYTNFYIHEPKRRLVSAAPFRGKLSPTLTFTEGFLLSAYSPAFPATGCFSGTKNRFAFTTVPGRSVQKLFLFTFCHTRFGR